ISNAAKSGVNFATVPALSISPAAGFTFTNITVGTTSPLQTGTLTASGGSVTVTNSTLTGAGFGLSGITFPVTLAPGQTQNFNVSFSPLATGSMSGTLSFTSNASSTTPASISLTGTGAGLGLSPTSLNFGLVPDATTSSAQTGSLTATGVTVTITAAKFSGAAFSFSVFQAFPFPITAGQSKQFSVPFSPASPGPASGSISFVSGLNNVTQTLSGTGTSNVALTWTASTTANVTYNVYRCSISAAACTSSQPGNFGSPIATGITATSYTDLTVSSGVTYYYAITAVDTTNTESSLSVVATAVIP